MKVDTLAVFATNRGPYIIQDQLAALHWGLTLPHMIVVVDDTGDCLTDKIVDAEAGPGAHIVIPSIIKHERNLSGFKNHEAIRWALEHNIDFDQVLCIDDDSLPIGRGVGAAGAEGIDVWAKAQLGRTAVDLLGVQDRVNYQNRWYEVKPLMDAWLLEARQLNWMTDLSAETIFYAINFMSRSFTQTLYDRKLLVPTHCERWPLWPDIYISWVCQVLGFYTSCWGHMDRPCAPIYANHRNSMRFAPDPRILRDEFLIYHPIRYVTAYDEQYLRDHYAGVRSGRSG